MLIGGPMENIVDIPVANVIGTVSKLYRIIHRNMVNVVIIIHILFKQYLTVPYVDLCERNQFLSAPDGFR